MSNQMTPRWRLALPALSDLGKLFTRLMDLERTLNRLHGRVEYPAPSIEPRVACSTNTTINSGSFADVTGATVTYTPEVDGSLLVVAYYSVACATFSAITDIFGGNFAVNGSTQAFGANCGFTAANDLRNASQGWVIPVTAKTAYTLKLQARQSAGTSTYNVIATRTGFTFQFFPSAYRYPS